MTEHQTRQKKRAVLWGTGSILLLVILYYLSPLAVDSLMTFQLRKTFSEQSRLFTGPIASLGVAGEADDHFQCDDEQYTHWQTESLCQNFATYIYDVSPISKTAKDTYPRNAAAFDLLLKQQGWVPDRPGDPVSTLAGSDPYAAQNRGEGGGVPFHKNIGSIDCNLEIDFNGLSELPDPASINVNEFSCSQHIRFFMPHLTPWQATGP